MLERRTGFLSLPTACDRPASDPGWRCHPAHRKGGPPVLPAGPPESAERRFFCIRVPPERDNGGPSGRRLSRRPNHTDICFYLREFRLRIENFQQLSQEFSPVPSRPWLFLSLFGSRNLEIRGCQSVSCQKRLGPLTITRRRYQRAAARDFHRRPAREGKLISQRAAHSLIGCHLGRVSVCGIFGQLTG
jgi:hypothetical protein